VYDFVIEAERDADHATVDDVVRRAFAHRPEVADMVAAIRASLRFRPGFALVARVGDGIAGFVAAIPRLPRYGGGTVTCRLLSAQADRVAVRVGEHADARPWGDLTRRVALGGASREQGLAGRVEILDVGEGYRPARCTRPWRYPDRRPGSPGYGSWDSWSSPHG
jgi:hypothetical protein